MRVLDDVGRMFDSKADWINGQLESAPTIARIKQFAIEFFAVESNNHVVELLVRNHYFPNCVRVRFGRLLIQSHLYVEVNLKTFNGWFLGFRAVQNMVSRHEQ